MNKENLILSDKVEKLLKDNATDKKSKSYKRKLDTTLFDKISKKGLLEKSEYTLPLSDTLGQRLYSAFKFNSD